MRACVGVDRYSFAEDDVEFKFRIQGQTCAGHCAAYDTCGECSSDVACGWCPKLNATTTTTTTASGVVGGDASTGGFCMPLETYSGVSAEDDECPTDVHEEGCCPECTTINACNTCVQNAGCGWSFDHGNCTSILGDDRGLCGIEHEDGSGTSASYHQVSQPARERAKPPACV